MDLIVMGLKACDTCRAARKALEAAGHEVTFRDVRDAPLSGDEIAALHAQFGDALVNRRSTTWRGLDTVERDRPPVELLTLHPALMKRPVIRSGNELHLGWGVEVKSEILG